MISTSVKWLCNNYHFRIEDGIFREAKNTIKNDEQKTLQDTQTINILVLGVNCTDYLNIMSAQRTNAM